MERTITVKGIGHLNLKPDLTVVTFTLKSTKKVYEKAMEDANEKLSALQTALTAIGFDKKDLKTTNFNVCTEYDSVRDANGNYKSVFKGYTCRQDLKLEFDFDTAQLSKVLSAVTGCISEPELSIHFSVKDKAAVSEALLKSAAENARAKAEILAAASGVQLGQLLTINYNWGEIELFSRTNYAMDDRCMGMPKMAAMEIEPDDIEVNDTAAFVWEIR
ncbi:MAG: SIMPL domain-containing protein [Clostridia bacterium]|nr:SIMPL domain-containing protein [Clostridia bacterium]